MIKKIKPEDIDVLIASVEYIHRDTFTICVLTLTSGMNVAGTSGALSAEWHDPIIGREVALRRAKDQLWQLEGYARLRDDARGSPADSPPFDMLGGNGVDEPA